MGYFMGLIMIEFIKRTNEGLIEVVSTLVFAYGTFIIAEEIHVSGVLAVVALELQMSQSGKPHLADEQIMHHFWELMEFIANVVIFAISGFHIAREEKTDEGGEKKGAPLTSRWSITDMIQNVRKKSRHASKTSEAGSEISTDDLGKCAMVLEKGNKILGTLSLMTGELHYMSAQAQSMVLSLYVVFEYKLPHSLMFSAECQLYHLFHLYLTSQENHSNSNIIDRHDARTQVHSFMVCGKDFHDGCGSFDRTGRSFLGRSETRTKKDKIEFG